MKVDADTRFEELLFDAQRQLDALRGEIEKYRIAFDSARLIVGHEFIKPLTSISGYLELLEGDRGRGDDAKDAHYFLKIREAVGRLDDLVEAFVQMLRFESPAGQPMELERVDVARLVEKVRERFESDAGRIENAADGDLPALTLRRSGVEVVLENLVSNAIKNSDPGSPITVRASLRRERRGNSNRRLLMVSVEDRGVGIPENEINDVFNPFYRVGGGRENCGLGLGLALVKSIITIMGGEIHIKSKPGAGTTVTFSVPITDDLQVPPERID
jgi:signal transduction histidine kinase